jgi:hypothetical protein
MKKIVLLCIVALGVITTWAQKTVYDANAQVRSVRGFHAIQVSGGIDLYLSSGDEAVAVSAKDLDDRERIKTEVENGVLKIWYDWKSGVGFLKGVNRQLKAYVSYKTLDRLSASGGSDVEVDGTISANKFSLDISGGSDFRGKFNAQELTINQSGGADISVGGKAGKLTIDASGGSDFNGYDLEAETAAVSASGGSDAELTVTKQLTANASGGSDISYRGNAPAVTSNKSGGSSVRKSGR